MDEPTARRRRHARGANSVSVAELLAKSTPDEQASMSAIQARAAAEASARSTPATPAHGQPAVPAHGQPAVPRPAGQAGPAGHPAQAGHAGPPGPATAPMPRSGPAMPMISAPYVPPARLPDERSLPHQLGHGGHPGQPGWAGQPDLPPVVAHQGPLTQPARPGLPGQPRFDDYLDDDHDEGDDHGRDEDLPPGDEDEEPRSSSRLAKTIIVTLVAMVATGVVTAVAIHGAEPPQRLTPSVPVVQPVAMTGPEVLRLSVVIDSLSLGSHEVNPSAVPEPATSTSPAPPTTAGLLVGADVPSQSGAGQPSVTVGSRSPAVNRELAESVVLDFYEALPRQKPHAYSLLSPAMQGDGQEAFEASWLRASDVNPRILTSADGDDSVRASITVSRFTDPEVTRLIVRLDVRPIAVDGASQLRIVGAQLLSAHRS